AQGSHASRGGDAISTGTFSMAGAVVLKQDFSGFVEPGADEIGWVGRAGHVPLGYYKDAAKTARTFPVVGGTRYAVPGDHARLLADDTIVVLGRGSVSINTGGEKVYAEEVEQVLRCHRAGCRRGRTFLRSPGASLSAAAGRRGSRRRGFSVLGDRSELIRHQAPASPLVDPHVDGTVLAAGFLPAVFPLQCETAGDDRRVSVDAHVLILVRDRLDLGVTGLGVLEALLLGEERAVRIRERVVIVPDVIEGRQIALRDRFAVRTNAFCERRGPAAGGLLGRFLRNRDGHEYAAEGREREELPHGSPPSGRLWPDRRCPLPDSGRYAVCRCQVARSK